jgi:hypothetical protein
MVAPSRRRQGTERLALRLEWCANTVNMLLVSVPTETQPGVQVSATVDFTSSSDRFDVKTSPKPAPARPPSCHALWTQSPCALAATGRRAAARQDHVGMFTGHSNAPVVWLCRTGRCMTSAARFPLCSPIELDASDCNGLVLGPCPWLLMFLTACGLWCTNSKWRSRGAGVDRSIILLSKLVQACVTFFDHFL